MDMETNTLFQAFFVSWERRFYDTKMFREDRHGLEENWVDETTRRRRRSSQASFFF